MPNRAYGKKEKKKEDVIDLEFMQLIFVFASHFCSMLFIHHLLYSYYICFGMQYRMPDAYDQEGGVNQEKRFSVALQRYRSVDLKKCIR